MDYLKKVQNSIYSPVFYSKLLQEKFSKSIVYFLILILILTLIKIASLMPFLREVPTRIQEGFKQTINCYPKDLEINIKNGQVGTNVKEPYFVSTCGLSGDKSDWVIDTKNSYSPQKFEEYRTSFWLTKDSMVYRKSDVEIRTYKLSDVKDFKVDKALIDSFSNKISPYLKFIGPILIIFTALGVYFFYILRLVYLLMLSAIILVLSKIFKKKLTFSQSCKVGLHALTLGLIIDLILGLSNNSQFHGFPFMVTFITLGVVATNLFLPKKA